MTNNEGVQARIKSNGLQLSEVCDAFSVSRPTLRKYIEKFDNGNTIGIPNPILDFFYYISTDDKVDARTYLLRHADPSDKFESYISFLYRNLPQDLDTHPVEILSALYAGDRKHDGSVVSDKATGLDPDLESQAEYLVDTRKFMANVLKDYIITQCSTDFFTYSEDEHAFIGSYKRPELPETTYSLYYRYYIYLRMIEQLLAIPYVKNCKLNFVKNAQTMFTHLITTMYYFLYDLDNDNADVDDLIKEYNRPTFDPSRDKAWYVVAAAVSPIIDDYPEGYSEIDVQLVRATSYEDAEYKATNEDPGAGFSRCYHSVYAFGPFPSKPGADKVSSYLQISWEVEKQPRENFLPPEVVTKWLESQSQKSALKGKNASSQSI